jgi:hypothetical protein
MCLVQVTCEAVYPNSSLALVSLRSDGSLECHCGLAEAVTQQRMGPELCCDRRCANDGACGGSHTFSNGEYVARCFSVYCVPPVDDGLASTNQTTAHELAAAEGEPDAVELRAAEAGKENNNILEENNLTQEEEEEEEIEDILREIYYTQMRTNIVSVVVVGLLVALVILVLSLVVVRTKHINTYRVIPCTFSSFAVGLALLGRVRSLAASAGGTRSVGLLPQAEP